MDEKDRQRELKEVELTIAIRELLRLDDEVLAARQKCETLRKELEALTGPKQWTLNKELHTSFLK